MLVHPSLALDQLLELDLLVFNRCGPEAIPRLAQLPLSLRQFLTLSVHSTLQDFMVRHCLCQLY